MDKKETIAAIRQYLNEKHIEYTFEEENKFCYRFTVAFSYLRQFEKVIYIPKNHKGFIVYTTTPLVVDSENMNAFCEAVARINFGYIGYQGHFELDPDDGELRHMIYEKGTELDEIDNAISSGTTLFLRYEEALLNLSLELLSPKEAVTKFCDLVHDNINEEKQISKIITNPR